MKNKPMRLLIMNENYQDYVITSNFIRQIPSQNYLTYWCSDYHMVMDSMLNNRYDAYLIDYHLRGKKSTDYLVEAMIEECEEPVVLLTNQMKAIINRGVGSTANLIKSELNSEKLECGIQYAIKRSHSKQIKVQQLYETSGLPVVA